VAAALAGLLVPLMLSVSGGWAALVALLACAGGGLGLGYRLVISPEGIAYQRTWYGVRWRRLRLPLQTPVARWSTLEEAEDEAVVLESEPPVTLPAPRGQVVTLKRAVQEAIQRAGSGQPSEGQGGVATPQ
jgi:hypothetical protein